MTICDRTIEELKVETAEQYKILAVYMRKHNVYSLPTKDENPDFWNDKDAVTALRNWQHASYRMQHQKQTDSSRQHHLDYMHKHYTDHKEEDKERVRVHNKQYSKDNKEKLVVQHRRYRKKHPEMKQNEAARRRGAVGHFTGLEWKAKCAEYNNKCAYCGTRASDTLEGKLTNDHVIPIVRGGNNCIDNQVPACLKCNIEKGTMTGEEFFASVDAGHEEGVMTRRYIVKHPEIKAKLLGK
jgi:hypothetical protein